jgi:hypothetical protein
MPQIDKVSFIFIVSDLIIIFFFTYILSTLYIFLPFFNVLKMLSTLISFVILNFNVITNFYFFNILKL